MGFAMLIVYAIDLIELVGELERCEVTGQKFIALCAIVL